MPTSAGRTSAGRTRRNEARKANLALASLMASTAFLNTDFTGADLTGCRVYGVSAWGLKLEGAKQQNLIITPYYDDDLDITPDNEPKITVDDVEVAQFIYLMLNNQRVRNVIDAITQRRY